MTRPAKPGRSLLGWLFPLPRVPDGPFREAATGYRHLKQAASLLPFRRRVCPGCGTGRLVRREDAAGLQAGAGAATGHPVLACTSPDCGYVAILDREISSPEAHARAQRLRGRAAATFGLALGAAVGGTALGLYLWSGYTMAGGLAVAAFLAAEGTVLRYRAWQLAYGRLYERRAPVGDWLAWEFGAKRPGVPGTEEARVVAVRRDG